MQEDQVWLRTYEKMKGGLTPKCGGPYEVKGAVPKITLIAYARKTRNLFSMRVSGV